ncbi:MAG: hypothetical protein HY018_04575 [Hydrogenophilales bacterium]|nr:hypothetical protein [Hydrogenophilales bacterium]
MPKIPKGCRVAATVSLCGINPSRTRLLAAALAVASGFLSAPAHALTFNVTYDSSVGSAPSGFQSAFQNAIGFYETSFSNPITINLNVGWGTLNGQAFTGLGGSQAYVVDPSYSSVRNALVGAGAPGSQTLPTSAPGGMAMEISTANAKALGFNLPGPPTSTDASIGFGSSYFYDFDPSNGVTSGTYDFTGIAEHEISEAMGRFSSLDVGKLSVQDLYRYTAPGVRDLSGTLAYFSVDGGVTNINTFNSVAGGDIGDWAGLTVDSFNAFASSGKKLPVSAGDLTLMASLGYTAVAPVPEPSEAAFMLAGLGLLGWRYRSRHKAS